MAIKVFNSQVYSNPYQKLLYTAIESRYQLASGSLSQAITLQRLHKHSLYHIHWEESLFARCTTTARAVRVRQEYVRKLKHYVALGGKVIWTLHNVKPHEWRFVQTLVSLRKELAALSHRILVHNQTALSTLQAQTGLTSLSTVRVLPHPAYFDVYEPADQTIALAGRPPKHPRMLLHFGLVRAYKGIPDLVQKLPEEFMVAHQLTLHICGKPVRADSFLNDLLAQTQSRSDIKYSLDNVPVAEVAELLRSHAGLILPYHKVLTSGVAILALTLGVPIVAPDTSAMRELFPESSYILLFNPRSTKDLRRAVLTLVDMSAETRMRIAQDCIKKALAIRPELISKILGEIYDELLGLTGGNEGHSSITAIHAPFVDIFPNETPISLQDQRQASRDRIAPQHLPPLLFRLISEDMAMVINETKSDSAALSNQHLAVEFAIATLASNVTRSTVSADLILNNTKKDVNKFTIEQARLDGAYAVRLYKNIMSALETADDKADTADAGDK